VNGDERHGGRICEERERSLSARSSPQDKQQHKTVQSQPAMFFFFFLNFIFFHFFFKQISLSRSDAEQQPPAPVPSALAS
jgi:hypothetical protein